MADTVAVMNAGRIEQLGAPATLYEHPASTFVANFLGQSNLLRGQVIQRPGRGRPGAGRRARPARSLLDARSAVPDGPARRVVGVRPEKLRPRARRGGPQPPARRRHRRLVHRRRHAVPRADAVGLRRRRRAAERRQRPGPGSARTSRCPGTRLTTFVLDAAQDDRAGMDEVADRWLRLAVLAPARRRRRTAEARATGCPTPCSRRACSGWSSSSSLPMVTLASQSLQEGIVEDGYTFTGNFSIYADALSAVLAAVPALVRLRRDRHGRRASCSAYPLAYFIAHKAGRWKNLMLVLVIAPFFTSFLIRTLAWQHDPRPTTARSPRSSRRCTSPTCSSSLRPDQQRPLLASQFAVIGGPDLQLPAVHDPAALRRARAARPPAPRGRRRPVRLAVAGLPQGHLAALAARASSPARC